MRRQLCRHRVHRCIPVPDPLSVPSELRVTLRGRSVVAEDPHYDERFLLHEGEGGRLLLFCADTEL